MAGSGVLWLPFIGAVIFAAVLTLRNRPGVSLRSTLSKALSKAPAAAIFLLATAATYALGKIFHLSHADWLSAPMAAMAAAFFQRVERRKMQPAISVLALAVAAIICAGVLQALGVAHPTLVTLGMVALGGCAAALFYRPLHSIARRVWLGL